MPPSTNRRRLLAALGGIATTGLAGCTQTSGSRHLSLPVPPPEPVENYTVGTVRASDGGPLMSGVDSDGEADRLNFDFLEAKEDLDSITFNRDTEAGAALERFVLDTDFAEHTVLLYEGTVSACYRYRLVRVARSADEIDMEFCQEPRAADVACDPDTEERIGFAIRLPFTGVSFQSIGAGWGRECPAYDLDGSTVVRLDSPTEGQ